MNPHWHIGLDEVGTGALAGPFGVAAVMVPADWKAHPSVRDSKQFERGTGEQRHAARVQVFEQHIKPEALIIQATLFELGRTETMGTAWRRAVHEVLGLVSRAVDREDLKQGVVILIDGAPRTGLPNKYNGIPIRFEVKGDARFAAIAAASIAAKVQRDRYMLELDAQRPQYGYRRHMGYNTAEHVRALADHGLGPEHRNYAFGVWRRATAQKAATP